MVFFPFNVVRSCAIAALLASCAGAGNYVWVQDLPPAATDAEQGYILSPGDMVAVQVFDQDKMSARQRVRRDGKLTLPFVGDVEAKGKRPSDLARDVEERLKAYIVSPRVTVLVEEAQPISVPVVGEVARPGVVNVEPASSVLQALATAGGPTEYADKDRIFVLRKQPQPRRIRFTYEALTRNDSRAITFSLQAGDVIVVE